MGKDGILTSFVMFGRHGRIDVTSCTKGISNYI